MFDTMHVCSDCKNNYELINAYTITGRNKGVKDHGLFLLGSPFTKLRAGILSLLPS